MGRIKEMSQSLANLIAAGEVVEAPSNIVKELVENSLDAKANNITIYLQSGGIKEIRIIDDGIGMDKEDLELAFLPHATSKIKTEYDLFRIGTLGFRGEAIPSIAAVSKMEISSKTNDSEAYSLEYHFGKKLELKKASIDRGTKVVVRELFYNTPARLKFLKAPLSELASISYLIDRLALANPHVSFTLYNDERLVFKTLKRNDLKSLIGSIYGLEASKKIVTLDVKEQGFNCHIVYLKPEIYRSNKLQMTYIVNGRYVKSYELSEMLVKAFNQFLPIGKYPIAILYLNLDPLLIDVNIHPKKAEIKISNIEEICSSLYSAIRNSLENGQQIKSVEAKEIIKKPLVEQNDLFSNEVNLKEEVKTLEVPKTIEKENNIEDIKPSFEISNTNIQEEITLNKPNDLTVSKKLPDLYFVGIVFDTYIIFQNKDGMYILDQHAAAERIRYEYYIEQMSNPNPLKIGLLVPLILELTTDEKIFVSLNIEKFKELGFTLEELSINSYAIREVPAWAHDKSLDDIIRGLIYMMINSKNVSIIPFRDNIAKQMSCKRSIKAHDRITKDEALHLIEELNKCKNPYHCPHGRPTLINISLYELKQMFERIQK